jgi:hypothetical protein
MRTIRIYELDITYPEGSEVHEGDWEDAGEGVEGYDARWVRRFPFERRFLSSSGATARAQRLAALGCTVDIRRSEPIQFEDEAAAHFDAAPEPDPYPEFEPAPAWSDVPF